MTPAMAFVFLATFGPIPGGGSYSIVIPENECHKVAIKINAPKHVCVEYRIAVPHTDVADAVQDELQDSGVIQVKRRSREREVHPFVAQPVGGNAGPFQNPLGYGIGPLKPATGEYRPRFSSCLISSVIIRATSRSLSSPDLVPNFRRNLLPLSSIGTPSGLHMTTKSSSTR